MKSDLNHQNPSERAIKIDLYYSYAAQDESLRLELEAHLALLARQGLLNTWSQLSIDLGQKVPEKSAEALDRADLVLLLLSSNFMTSNECFISQMNRAMERSAAGKCLVLPILLRSVDWEDAPFGALPVLPSDRQPVTRWPARDEAWLDVARGIREAIDRLLIQRCLEHPLLTPAPTITLTRADGKSEARVVFCADAELGRDSGCSFAFRLASKKLGKRHARLLWLPALGQFALQDLRSKNGTLLDGQRLRYLTPLRDGQRITLADSLSFSCSIHQAPIPSAVALTYKDAADHELGRYVMAPQAAWRVSGLGLPPGSSVEIRHTGVEFYLHDVSAGAGALGMQRLADGMQILIEGQSLHVGLRS